MDGSAGFNLAEVLSSLCEITFLNIVDHIEVLTSYVRVLVVYTVNTPLGAVHIVRTQQGGSGGPPNACKCVQGVGGCLGP